MEPKLLSNDVETAIEAAEAGCGITRVLSYQVRTRIAAGRLRRILAEAEPPAVPVSAVFAASRRGSPNVRAFLDAARRELGALSLG